MAASIAAFRKAIIESASDKKYRIDFWSGAVRRSSHLLEINTEPTPSILYVKISNSYPGFWGLTKNQLIRLEQIKTRWFVVLVAREINNGYVFTSDEIGSRVKDGTFELSDDGDYKVNENTDCDMKRAFRGLGTVINRIL